ncbi:Oidioi.mRNA.OKI2018_I69.PAR.g12943.t1.cds [Oikopleura dioica]|uniref:Peroxiredoxin-6 n=1 Tax=Oikopleura dioica TaxID=34765 RepID=A0ABN7S2J2_OIKDI|nr:Oidioi.mRNA.OKI2018_I69.PAR.g12943.t1.cds [Oikopleura dioica]
MSLKLGDTFPNLSMKTTWGNLNLYDYLGESWGILFSHPADYTPVCTTELGAAAKYAPEFKELNTKLIGLSIDTMADHEGWIKDIQDYNKLEGGFPFPLISDDRTIATQLGMLDPDELDSTGTPLTARAVFVIGPDRKLKLSLLYPATTGRNFDEIIRVVKSLQLTALHKVATPQNWKSGDKCMVVPSLTDEQATKRFAKGFEKASLPSGKGYIRLTPDPSQS